MCNKCADVSSLVLTRPSNSSQALQGLEWYLPAGKTLNASSGAFGAKFAAIEPVRNLTWMGDLLTSEMRNMSRWAYINATWMGQESRNGTVKAATCVLYGK